MTNAIDLLLAYLTGYKMTNDKIDIDLVMERAKEFKERETDTKVKEISFNSMLPAVKSFPLKQSECRHREQKRTWYEQYSTWRCDGCGKWYE